MTTNRRDPFMRRIRFLMLVLAPMFTIAATACDDETIIAGDPDRVYDQIERLGNPLVSEVTLAKRNHGFHNTGTPSSDVANHRAELEAFVTGFGRPQSLATTLSSVLLPDMLIIDTSKPATGAGWLTWARANGYGGRRLSDDVVDAGLAAIFGTLISTQNPAPAGLHTDNVGANNKPFLAAFPYLAAAN